MRLQRPAKASGATRGVAAAQTARACRLSAGVKKPVCSLTQCAPSASLCWRRRRRPRRVPRSDRPRSQQEVTAASRALAFVTPYVLTKSCRYKV